MWVCSTCIPNVQDSTSSVYLYLWVTDDILWEHSLNCLYAFQRGIHKENGVYWALYITDCLTCSESIVLLGAALHQTWVLITCIDTSNRSAHYLHYYIKQECSLFTSLHQTGALIACNKCAYYIITSNRSTHYINTPTRSTQFIKQGHSLH